MCSIPTLFKYCCLFHFNLINNKGAQQCIHSCIINWELNVCHITNTLETCSDILNCSTGNSMYVMSVTLWKPSSCSEIVHCLSTLLCYQHILLDTVYRTVWAMPCFLIQDHDQGAENSNEATTVLV